MQALSPSLAQYQSTSRAIPAAARGSIAMLSAASSAPARIHGRRGLSFLFADVRDRFVYLKHEIAVLLVFVGTKMLVAHWWHLPTSWSLGFIATVIAVAVAASVAHDRRAGSGAAPAN